MTTQPNSEVIRRDTVIHTPYQGSYRQELDTPDSPPPAPVPETPPQAEPESPEEKTFKKRYGDLRTHMNTIQANFQREKAEMQARIDALSKKKVELPKTEAELTAFAQEYPDIFKTLVSIARKESIETKTELESRFESVKQAEQTLSRERAALRLAQLHPDWEDLRESEEFHAWAKEQLPQIQEWLYENPDNPDLCAKAIDLYKLEKGLVQKDKKQRGRPQTAADAVIKPKHPDVAETPPSKKIWKESEIQKLARSKPNWFEENEAEIDLAMREGRIERDLSAPHK